MKKTTAIGRQLFVAALSGFGIMAMIGMPIKAHAANLLKDGSFEAPVVSPPASTAVFKKGTTFDAAWLVNAGSVSVVNNTLWDAKAGTQSLELSSPVDNFGSVQQTFSQSPTPTNDKFEVSFWAAAAPTGSETSPRFGSVSILNTTTGSKVFDFTLTRNGNTTTNLGYQKFSFTFSSLSSTNGIQLASLRALAGINGAAGIVIDDVKVVALPEVSTLLGFACILALGVGLRRKNQAGSMSRTL